ncbi:peptidylprolyl isomerase [Allopontixanthobacter sp.]|uniref:peptidylprolyl isomerase n=1 Tax=Allopontixanthobacter sp. TaxID=2906452 RepID=UPI002AB9C9C5|nr:SurA N-terminal domain-containing protein [Allopontixanthobacter sp.]MDZ4306552.1 SurA N-terminal domain-containing protein [Allopontixanthobacter sp.]
MISFFRKFLSSKIGIAVALGFLALIAFAFAAMDVSSSGAFGGVAGGDRVAVVGDEKIDSSELSIAATSALDSARRQNPLMSMPAFLQQGGLNQVLDQLIDRYAISGFAEKYGLRAGDNLVNSEIIAIPAFRGADGNFDEQAYRQALSSQGLSDAIVRADLAGSLLAEQILVPASLGAVMPDKLVSRYAVLLKETRVGSIGLIPSLTFAPQGNPTASQLQAFYTANRGDYIRPERRVIRYASFDGSAIGDAAEPTAAEIAARYERDRQLYADSETRSFSQLIVPTQQAANAIRSRVQSGGSLETAASEAGLAVAKLGPLDSRGMAAQTSVAVAQAAFAAGQNTLAAPARSGLGWHVIRVDNIERVAGRSLAQATPEIAEAIRAEKRRAALSDLTATIEERLEDGEGLAEVARELKLDVATTKPLLATGQIYGSENEAAPPVLAPALKTAFAMDEGEPQLAEVLRGETFLMFEVSDITPSTAAPLAEIREGVIQEWRRAEGSKSAKAAADRVLKRLAGGATLAQAMSQEQQELPPVDAINLSREQLSAQGRQVPAPLALFFSMAQGTAKKLEAPQNAGWFVVDLDNIEPGTIAPNDPKFQQTKRELGQLVAREYADQLRLAMREELGVERNTVAIEAVRKQLIGAN